MMDLTPEELADIRAVFLEEAHEQLDELARLLELLPDMRGSELEDTIQSCFRVAHNIKGTALSVDYPRVAELAHAVEAVLSEARETASMPPPARVQDMLEASSLILAMLEGRAQEGAEIALIDQLAATRMPPADEPGTSGGAPAEGARGGSEPPVDDMLPDSRRRTTVRVETRRLDRLMGHAGELLASRSIDVSQFLRLKELQRELVRVRDRLHREARHHLDPLEAAVASLIGDGEQTHAKFGYLIESLHEDLKRLRMQPLGDEAPAWRRVVRDTARALGKQVRVEIQVGDIELDRNVLDALRDPFVHFLRNAVDHGLELPDERTAAGKDETGTIRIAASLQGPMVRLEVADDGRGLDLERIAAVAAEKGLATAAELEDRSRAEVLGLMFSPGFSTADRVSRISGRGVGLDVVRERIETLGGSVGLADDGRAGAAFVLHLPVSLLSTRGLIVRAGPVTYALPIDHVSRAVAADPEEIRGTQAAGQVLQVDGEPVRLRWLASARTGPSAGRVSVIVVSKDQRRIGVVVDEILGEQVFVTRSLPWNLRRVPGTGGALIQADGTVAVVIDVVALFDAQPGERPSEPADQNETPRTRSLHVLVVDDSLASRMLQRTMLSEAGYQVSLAADGAEAWELLRAGDVDAVVSDVHMPRVDGFELTRMVRRSETLRHLPVVLVTNLGSAKDIARGAAAGADEYLVKGTFDRADLIQAIERLL